VHADLIDQAERECLLQDGRAMQTDNLVALRALGLLNRADDAVGDDVTGGYDVIGLLWVTTKRASPRTLGGVGARTPSPRSKTDDDPRATVLGPWSWAAPKVSNPKTRRPRAESAHAAAAPIDPSPTTRTL
jgi:hypothetical protein